MDDSLGRRESDDWLTWCSLFKPHPWHGLDLGEEAPQTVTCYIEIVPLDTVKYEVDRLSGYLTVDRPQRFSNVCPTLYGFLPQTFCGRRVAERCAERSGKPITRGDQDPVDICVFTERDLAHGDILLRAVPVGGLRMIDGEMADEKIIAVLEEDAAYSGWRDIEDCAPALLDRLKHYFLTYKAMPAGSDPSRTIVEVYGRDEAHEVIRRGQHDYREAFSALFQRFEQWRAKGITRRLGMLQGDTSR